MKYIGRRIFSVVGLIVLILTISVFTNSCKKEVIRLPELTTKPFYYRTQNSASSGGDIVSDGGAKITECGVCWSTNPDPTIDDSLSVSVLRNATFTSSISELDADTHYYGRAYATNSAGTSYGESTSFKTLGPVSDIDGNSYNTVIIDNLIWFSSELKTTHYANGDIIDDGTEMGVLDETLEPKYWFAYGNDLDNIDSYGRLYTWYAATDNRNICPDGWHVASDSEWNLLFDNLGGRYVAGGKLKETGTMHWKSPNSWATNETSFNAVPGGMRYFSADFAALGYTARWWTSLSTSGNYARNYFARYNDGQIYYFNSSKIEAYSIRCVKD
jgi:uncharacterized protein (TIGR02145 family)